MLVMFSCIVPIENTKAYQVSGKLDERLREIKPKSKSEMFLDEKSAFTKQLFLMIALHFAS